MNQTAMHYRVVGIRADGTRDLRYKNLSSETAEQVKDAMRLSRLYQHVVIENQLEGKSPLFPIP